MVVASLMATMAFSAGLTPPGGLWQDNSKTGDPDAHKAGESILASEHSGVSLTILAVNIFRDSSLGGYNGYVLFNKIGFVASLSVILLLITDLPFKRGIFTWILTLVMWVAISSMAFTYLISVFNFTPNESFNAALKVLAYGVVAWVLVMGLVVVGHAVYLVIRLIRSLFRLLRRKRRPVQPSLPLYVNPELVHV